MIDPQVIIPLSEYNRLLRLSELVDVSKWLTAKPIKVEEGSYKLYIKNVNIKHSPVMHFATINEQEYKSIENAEILIKLGTRK